MHLFLDFDGVLHPDGTLALDEDFRLLENPELFCFLPILEKLLQPHPEVKIIVSSDWRRLFDDDALLRLLRGLGSRFAGVVEQKGMHRAEEIRAEVRRRGLAHWVAVDDHPSVRAAATGDWRFVWTPPELGLSDPGVQERLATVLAQLPV